MAKKPSSDVAKFQRLAGLKANKYFYWKNGKIYLIPQRDEKGWPIRNPFWDDKISQIEKMYKGGMTLRAIASYYKMASHGSLTTIVTEQGWIRKKVNYDKSMIKKLYTSGMTAVEVGDVLDISDSTVNRVAKRGSYNRTMSETVLSISIPRGRARCVNCNKETIEKYVSSVKSYKSCKEYVSSSRKLTESVLNYSTHVFDRTGRSRDFHIDHIFPIKRGYYKKVKGVWTPREKPIPIGLICHPANYNMLTREQNLYKGDCYSISLKELKRRIYNMNKIHPELKILEGGMS